MALEAVAVFSEATAARCSKASRSLSVLWLLLRLFAPSPPVDVATPEDEDDDDEEEIFCLPLGSFAAQAAARFRATKREDFRKTESELRLVSLELSDISISTGPLMNEIYS